LTTLTRAAVLLIEATRHVPETALERCPGIVLAHAFRQSLRMGVILMEDDESVGPEYQIMGDVITTPGAADIYDDLDTLSRARMMQAEDQEMQARQMMAEDTMKEAMDLPGGHAEAPPFDPAEWTVNDTE